MSARFLALLIVSFMQSCSTIFYYFVKNAFDSIGKNFPSTNQFKPLYNKVFHFADIPFSFMLLFFLLKFSPFTLLLLTTGLSFFSELIIAQFAVPKSSFSLLLVFSFFQGGCYFSLKTLVKLVARALFPFNKKNNKRISFYLSFLFMLPNTLIIPLETKIYRSLRSMDAEEAKEAYRSFWFLSSVSILISVVTCILYYLDKGKIERDKESSREDSGGLKKDSGQNRPGEGVDEAEEEPRKKKKRESSIAGVFSRIGNAAKACYSIKSILLFGVFCELIYEKYCGRKSQFYRVLNIANEEFFYKLDKLILLTSPLVSFYIKNIEVTFLIFRTQSFILLIFTGLNVIWTFNQTKSFLFHLALQLILGVANLCLKITWTSVFLQMVDPKLSDMAFTLFTSFRSTFFVLFEVLEVFIFGNERNSFLTKYRIFFWFWFSVSIVACVMSIVVLQRFSVARTRVKGGKKAKE